MRKLASTALIALLAVLIVPMPARAAATPWKLTIGRTGVVPGTTTSALRLSVDPPASALTPYELIFDITAAQGLLTLQFPFSPACTTTATTVTCAQNDRGFSGALRVTAEPDAPIGATVALPTRIVAGGKTVAAASGTVTVAEEVSLTPVQAQDDVSIPTGTTANLAAGLRNSGERPVTGVVLRLQTAVGMRTPAFSNCTPIQGRGAVLPTSGAACLFEGSLAPGQEYRLATPWPLTATDAVWAPSQWWSSFTWYTAQNWIDQGFALPGGGSGTELALTPAPGEVTETVPQIEIDPNSNPDNNIDEWELTVTGRNHSTFTVRGDKVTGQVGKTVTVRTSVRNNGPARLESWGNASAPYLTVTVTPPAGTTVVAHSELCQPFNVNAPTPGLPWPDGADFNDGNYYCWTGMFQGLPYFPGETVTFDFTLRINKPGTLRGLIRTELVPIGAPSVIQQQPILVNAAGAPAPSPTAPAQGGGGGLPITGGNTAAVALIGLALLVVGAATRLAARRR
ncbi:hypothetical protein [Paractinoplanes brasiliensis]|uniref:LPXTG-motif cell wall-anchored protein n=1 Tax=Paractinoplanes brasiliensis TaxID=52695 RepID=A0A4R6JZH8_9ACTN|nr:hypothetical protein [Actinoplanes brasiliensis]TDO42323.1 hypothetical protein C8E87_6093 [Actinoplanes brasiliensis]GID29554.1 hypothetical protein Abr02nite_45370 [Actinoplanes brasiliensis]